jgi:hypothetical protein
MPVIPLNQVSMARAEQLLAEIWRVLEEYSIASPRLTVEVSANDLVDVALTFDGSADAKLVWHALSGLRRIRGSATPLLNGAGN